MSSVSFRPTAFSIFPPVAAGVVGGLLAVLITGLLVFVLLRRRHIKRKRTMRRLLQEREVRMHVHVKIHFQITGFTFYYSDPVH